MTVLDPETQAIGQFWVAGAAPEKVTGVLDIRATSPELEVFGEITPSIIWRPNPDGEGSVGTPNDDSDELLIYGEMNGGGKPITLVNARTYGRVISVPTRVSAANTQRFVTEYALEGAHLDGEAQLYSEAVFSIEGLDVWAQFNNAKLTMNSDRTNVSLTYQTPESEVIQLEADLGSVVIEAGWTLTPTAGSRNTLETPPRCRWIAAEDMPKTLREIRSQIVDPLVALLGMSYRSKKTLSFLRLLPVGRSHWCDVKGSFLQAAKTVVDSKQTRPILDRNTLGTVVISRWLNEFATLSPFPFMLVSSFESSSALESQTLEMALTAEGLHRRLYPDSRNLTDAEVEIALEAFEAMSTGGRGVDLARNALKTYLAMPSFPQRIEKLAGDVSLAAPQVTGRTSRWKREVTEIRNVFAHASFTTAIGRDRLAVYLSLFRSLQWLIWTRMLLHVGLSAQQIASKLADDQSYLHFVRTSALALPKVYGPLAQESE